MSDDARSLHTEVAFLGFAERSSIVRDGMLETLKWNIIGLKHVLPFNYFPVSLIGASFILAFRHLAEAQLRFGVRSENGDELGWIQIGAAPASTPLPLPATAMGQPFFLSQLSDGWSVIAITIDYPITLMRPGRYFVARSVPEGVDEIIGEFWAGLVEPAPLSAERIVAIKSDPNAIKAVRAILSCNKCHTECRAHAGLERSENLEQEGFVWYTNLPEHFQCPCGAMIVDLTSMRR